MPHLFTCGSVDDSKSTLLGRSIGKDSSAMLHLAGKAFSPGQLPMPVLNIDTRWKFAEMTHFRQAEATRLGLDAGRYDAVIGGARRDGEASRSKERIFSLRDRQHGWDPKRQRPELWRVFNSRVGLGESMRAFPFSNWTELDVRRYIQPTASPWCCATACGSCATTSACCCCRASRCR